MMTWQHLIISVLIGLAFGVFIDIDHTGTLTDKLRCAVSIREEDCLQVGYRGVFHDARIWWLGLCGMTVWTAHLIMDGIL